MTQENNTPAATTNVEEPGSNIGEYITMNNGNSYSVEGPLASAYSDALDELYKKDRDPGTRLSMETQEMDSARQQRGWIAAKSALIDMDGNVEDMGMLYGVSRAQISHVEYIDVVDAFQKISGYRRAKSALVIDAAYANEGGSPAPVVSQKVVYEANAKEPSDPTAVAVAIDSTDPDMNGLTSAAASKLYGLALEEFALRHGIHVYRSLADFVKSHV